MSEVEEEAPAAVDGSPVKADEDTSEEREPSQDKPVADEPAVEEEPTAQKSAAAS